MFVETKTITVKEGFAQTVAERFSKPGAVEQMPGFVDLSVMVKRARNGEEQVLVMIRWESEEAWKAWEKSDVHIQGHRQSAKQGRPDYILSSSHDSYQVSVLKSAAPAALS
jgi:heme oxygenase (staphylobilin-producing)